MSSIDERLDHALQQAIARLGGDSGTIHLKEPDRRVLRLRSSQAIPAAVLDAVREVPWGKGMAGVAAERAEPVDHCNIQTSSAADIHAGARTTGMQGAIVVPMMHGSDVVGTIGIGCRAERTFSPADVEWLMEFGRTLATEVGAASPM